MNDWNLFFLWMFVNITLTNRLSSEQRSKSRVSFFRNNSFKITAQKLLHHVTHQRNHFIWTFEHCATICEHVKTLCDLYANICILNVLHCFQYESSTFQFHSICLLVFLLLSSNETKISTDSQPLKCPIKPKNICAKSLKNYGCFYHNRHTVSRVNLSHQ